MNRKIASALYLMSGILIALGGLGHSLGAVGQVHEAFGKVRLDAHTADLVIAVWHFAGAAMVALGAMVVSGWWKTRHGEVLDESTPLLIALFYIGYGIAALAWMREPFWSVFIVFGLLAGLSGRSLGGK
ncbi:MAG: hypothetical protein H6686_10865 [Fibrobacteria bacterium]|nr:hypothetical protein [Fibrobacteria bacterium]